MLFLSRDPFCDVKPWSEDQIQMYIVQEARRSGYMVHGDQNKAKRSPAASAVAKACGMLSGWPDMCFVLSGGLVFVELKLAGKGRVSPEQRTVHDALIAAGIPCHAVYADCPGNGWYQVLRLIK